MQKTPEQSVFSTLLDTIVDYRVSASAIDEISNSLIGKTAKEADDLVVEYTRKIKAGQLK